MKTEKTRRTLVILEILIILILFVGFAFAAINPPTNVNATLSGTSMTVTWTAATGATQYRIGLYNMTGTSTLINYMYVNTTSVVITVPLASNCYTAHVRTWLPNQSTNSVVSNKVCGVVPMPTPTPVPTSVPTLDTTPPGSIDNLHNVSYVVNSIKWTWTDPATSDFDHVDIYIDGIFKTGVAKGIKSYTAVGLNHDTEYEISTRSVDASGNVNDTWINNTATTATSDTIPPGSIDNLRNVSYVVDSIKWTWTDPATSDFDHVDVYIDGIFKTGVTRGVEEYTVMGLDPDTKYEIGTHTVDTSGNINNTWLNDTARTDIPDIIPPGSISNLHNTSYSPDHIDWAWTNPTTPDFEQVDIYIDGIFKTSVTGGVEGYASVGLNPDTTYKIGTHTLDISGNVNKTWKNATARTAKLAGLPTIRFITIGDTHITSNTSTDQYNRFTRAISYINGRTDVDFVVHMGDIVDSGSDSSYTAAKSIMSKLKVPYYVIEGNHGSGPLFNKYFGKDEHMEYFPNSNGYQLIFPAYNSGNWSFNYDIADKNRPTIIFNHGQVQPKPGGTSCINDWGSYYSYACSMRSEVDKFTKLLGYYNGHVHSGTRQIINGSLFVTEDNLGGNGADSDFIGYTIIQNGIVTYNTVRY